MTGPFGAGCSTLAKELENYHHFRKYSLSDAMRELAPRFIKDLDKQKLVSPKDREYQQWVGNEIRKQDFYAIPQKVFGKIRDDEKKDSALASMDIVVDGIRNPGEMVFLRDKFPHFFVISVFASFSTRWKRSQKAYEGNEWSFRRDDERDSGESEPSHGQKVQLCVDRSDISISNDIQFDQPSIKEELQNRLGEYVHLMKEPAWRGSHPWELNMAQAYDASLASTCCKRKVGAVVVKEEADVGDHRQRNYVIATGYNEVPLNIKSCADRGGRNNPEYCYKDEKIKEVIRRDYQKCPKCGTEIKFEENFTLPIICSNPECDARIGKDFIPGRMLDICPAVHAEESAILQASKFGGTQIDGSVLYTTTFPCPLCAKMIVQAGIIKCYFVEPYPQDDAIKALDEGGITAQLFEGVKGRAYHRLFEHLPIK